MLWGERGALVLDKMVNKGQKLLQEMVETGQLVDDYFGFGSPLSRKYYSVFKEIWEEVFKSWTDKQHK